MNNPKERGESNGFLITILNQTTCNFRREFERKKSEVATKVRTTLGLSYSRTTNYTITINIPANSSKLSKLGFASDFFKQNYNYYMYTNGVVTVAENSYIKTPLADTYLLVYYK